MWRRRRWGAHEGDVGDAGVGIAGRGALSIGEDESEGGLAGPDGAIGGEGEGGGGGVGDWIVLLVGDSDAVVAAVGAEGGASVEGEGVGAFAIGGVEEGDRGIHCGPTIGIGDTVGRAGGKVDAVSPRAFDAAPAAGHFDGVGEHEAVVVVGCGSGVDADGRGGFDYLLRRAGAGPKQMQCGTSHGLVVIQFDGVGLSRHEVDRAFVSGGSVIGPIVDE